jgi:hypothetical protein
LKADHAKKGEEFNLTRRAYENIRKKNITEKVGVNSCVAVMKKFCEENEFDPEKLTFSFHVFKPQSQYLSRFLGI